MLPFMTICMAAWLARLRLAQPTCTGAQMVLYAVLSELIRVNVASDERRLSVDKFVGAANVQSLNFESYVARHIRG